MHKLGSEWTFNDLVEDGYADTVRGKQSANGKIDYVFVNERVGRMVKDVKINFIDNFQHAAIDVKIEMVIHKGPSDVLSTGNKLSECDPLRGSHADEYTYWAEENLK